MDDVSKEFFTIFPQHKIANIANLFHSKLTRPIKSAILKGNPFYQLTFNFTFRSTNILRTKQRRKLQIYGNTKLVLMPVLPTLCVWQKCRTNWIYITVAGFEHYLWWFLVTGMLRGFNSEDDDDVFVDPDAQNKVPSPSVPCIWFM